LAFIKKEDWLKPIADPLLRKIHSGELEGIYASTASIEEIVFWFFNRKLIDELVTTVNALTHINNLEWIGITKEVCLNASILMSEYQLNPFDAYHAATAMMKDKKILSTEHIYDRIKGLERIKPEIFAKTL